MALIGEDVMIFCMSYIYAGKLTGVNEEYILLEEAKIVLRGLENFTDKGYSDAQPLPNKKHLYYEKGILFWLRKMKTIIKRSGSGSRSWSRSGSRVWSGWGLGLGSGSRSWSGVQVDEWIENKGRGVITWEKEIDKIILLTRHLGDMHFREF